MLEGNPVVYPPTVDQHFFNASEDAASGENIKRSGLTYAGHPQAQVTQKTGLPSVQGGAADQRWQIPSPDPGVVDPLVSLTGLSPLLVQVLVQRGMASADQIGQFLNPEQQRLPSPLTEFPDLTSGLELLVEMIQTQGQIAICGDYDADGMTSTALLLRALRSLGGRVDYTIPSRMQEG